MFYKVEGFVHDQIHISIIPNDFRKNMFLQSRKYRYFKRKIDS
jgi:hypothetical protein